MLQNPRVESTLIRRKRLIPSIFAASTSRLFFLDFGVLVDKLLSASSRQVSNISLASKLLKALVECPLHGVLDRLVKEAGQEWNYRQSQSNGAPCSEGGVFDILHCLSRVLDHAVDGECRQSHTGDALEDGSLHHDGSPVLQWRDYAWGDVARLFLREARDSLLVRVEQNLGVEDPLVLPIGTVSFMRHIAENVEP